MAHLAEREPVNVDNAARSARTAPRHASRRHLLSSAIAACVSAPRAIAMASLLP